jgi:hypothetical protein
MGTKKRYALQKANGGSHTASEWDILKSWFNYRCVRCGNRADELTKDHIVPVSKGGTDSIWNIQPLCRSCNTSKRDYFATDYRDSFFHRFLDEYKRLTQSPSYFSASLEIMFALRWMQIEGDRKKFEDILWVWGLDEKYRKLALDEFERWIGSNGHG